MEAVAAAAAAYTTFLLRICPSLVLPSKGTIAMIVMDASTATSYTDSSARDCCIACSRVTSSAIDSCVDDGLNISR